MNEVEEELSRRARASIGRPSGPSTNTRQVIKSEWGIPVLPLDDMRLASPTEALASAMGLLATTCDSAENLSTCNSVW